MKTYRAWIILPQDKRSLTWPVYRTKAEAKHTINVYGLKGFRIVPVEITYSA